MILILGGTSLAHRLALALDGQEFTVSLAGLTDAPERTYRQRLGGFGGVNGLAAYLRDHKVSALIDATHPFAAQIGAHAAQAAQETQTPILRLEHSAWRADEGNNWTSVPTLAEAASALPSGARVLLTVGRNSLTPFVARNDCWFLSRGVADAPPEIPNGEYLQARPPFPQESEHQLMKSRNITHLVAKNAGGAAMSTKLAAAHALDIPIIMVERPARPVIDTVDSVGDTLIWLKKQKALT